MRTFIMWMMFFAVFTGCGRDQVQQPGQVDTGWREAPAARIEYLSTKSNPAPLPLRADIKWKLIGPTDASQNSWWWSCVVTMINYGKDAMVDSIYVLLEDKDAISSHSKPAGINLEEAGLGGDHLISYVIPRGTTVVETLRGEIITPNIPWAQRAALRVYLTDNAD